MNRIFTVSLLTFIASLSLLTGCMPRGETKTLDELLVLGKSNYETSLKADNKISPDVSESLKKLTSSFTNFLDSASNSKASQGAATEIAETLSTLTMKAGYTNRPGLGALAKQFRSFEDGGDAKRTQAKAKLLVARTYETVASELATTGFKL